LETEGGRVRTRTSGQRFFWTTGGAERHRPRQESLFEKTSKEVDPHLSLRPGACPESRIAGDFSHSTQLRPRTNQSKRRITSRGYASSPPSNSVTALPEYPISAKACRTTAQSTFPSPKFTQAYASSLRL